MTWSDGFLTVPRGSCTDRPLKNFAALHRLRWLSVMEFGAHSKRQKPQRLLAAAFDICFDKCCLLKFQIPLAIKHLRALYGGEGVRRNRIFEGLQSSPIVALTQRHTREKRQKHISRRLQKSTL
jgi:hypothetical protein